MNMKKTRILLARLSICAALLCGLRLTADTLSLNASSKALLGHRSVVLEN